MAGPNIHFSHGPSSAQKGKENNTKPRSPFHNIIYYKHLHIISGLTHFGLVQVTIKPLTRQGLNTYVVACLRDARHLNFECSSIGAIETNLCNGYVYFDGYPDLTISLTDTNILETLKINIKLHGYNMLLGSEIKAIIYHIC
ncbi:MP domain-containing protein [Cephalotus follicularis]|uniref:MP domain-containing protein n=1 Tax=Cephalotus follicularis TaxID=3775 RepID=A0A1Q3BSZ6_CEPFO|nr:MP domain-containing protein [Cephalotus follicularis]